MAKANKKSLDAKAYINAQVNEIREKIRKTPDEEARKQLAENFKETTSSEEYQENLAVVQEDTDIIREYSKRKKWWDITPEEFDAAKVDFYGKNMNLEFWEDFEKLDLWKKVDYIFEKFWDTDYAADLIISIISASKNNKNGIKFKKRILSDILRKGEYYDGALKDAIDDIFDKFWAWQIWLRLAMLFSDCVNVNRMTDLIKETYVYDRWFYKEYKRNVTENTLKYILKWNDFCRWVVFWCKDYSISDQKILDYFVSKDIRCPMKKLTSEWQKYYIEKFLEYSKNNGWDKYFEAPTVLYLSSFNDMNLWEWVDPIEFIMSYTLKIFNDEELEKSLLSDNFQKMHMYHKQIVDLFIKAWKIDVVKKSINNLIWLSDMEKAEIMGDTELEDKLNREKFNSDLAKLQELWEKLWVIIEVKEKKELEQGQSEDDEEEEKEKEKEKWKWWRNWFWKKWKK